MPARNNFDFLRFMLASLVVFSHSFPLGTGNEDTEPLAVMTGHQLTFGSLAVDCFFVISGYLIAQSWVSRPDWRVFLAKRIRRIYPGFIVAATLGAFVIAPVFSEPGYDGIHPSFVTSFVLDVLQLKAPVPSPAFEHNPARGTVNGSLWSIAYEFWCYVGVLVVGLAGGLRKRRLLWTGLAVSIAISLLFVVLKLSPGGGIVGRIFGYPPFWARLLPFFIVGMAFRASRDRVALTSRGALACGASLVVGAIVPYGMTVVLPVAAAYLLLWFAELPVPRVHGFARHGDLSYGIYLYSFPILQIVMVLQGGAVWSPYLLFLVAWPLSIVAAAASWHLVERWFIEHSAPKTAPSALTAKV